MSVCRRRLAYRDHARDNPHLYVVMYGTASLGGYRRTGNDLAQGRYTFDAYLAIVREAIEAGRFRDDDPLGGRHPALGRRPRLHHARVGRLLRTQLRRHPPVPNSAADRPVVGVGDRPTGAAASAQNWLTQSPAPAIG